MFPLTYSLQLAVLLAAFSSGATARPGVLENAKALHGFFQRVREAQGDSKPIHVLQYGDSHTASDDWVDAMRKKAQARWGNGGPGFATAGHIRGYRRLDVAGTSSAGWQSEGTVGKAGDGRNGLSGISLSTERAGETVTLSTSAERLELVFLKQPEGGAFTVSRDGDVITSVESEGAFGTGTYAVPTAPGQHLYTVATTSTSPVRLFGWASDNSGGITWETLGINGAQVRMLLGWDRRIWIEQLQARDAALVVLAYGTNEALSPAYRAATYEADLRAVIRIVREGAPHASLLLVGPPACDRRRPFAHLRSVIEVQRKVSREMDCAFWDWEGYMNATGGRAAWVRKGWSQGDLVHLTGEGYRRLGEVLAGEILGLYPAGR